MTALNTLQFNGYILRPVNAFDRKLAEQWTAWDSEHAGQIPPEFWLEQSLGVDSALLLDGKGPVFFFRVNMYEEERGIRRAEVFIQFMPCSTEEDRERTRGALLQGTAWLEPILEQSGVEEIFFDTRNEQLIAFCVKRLSFKVGEAVGMSRPGAKSLMRLRKALGVVARAE